MIFYSEDTMDAIVAYLVRLQNMAPCSGVIDDDAGQSWEYRITATGATWLSCPSRSDEYTVVTSAGRPHIRKTDGKMLLVTQRPAATKSFSDLPIESSGLPECSHEWVEYGLYSGKRACKHCNLNHPDNRS